MNRRRIWWISLPLLLGLVGLISWLWARSSHRYDRIIRSAAERYQVDPALVKAVMWQESRFHPRIRGRVGEIGLMQLRELAAVEWSTAEKIATFEMEHLVDPRTNTLAGTWYLARLLRRYKNTDDPVPYALADYNAGRANVLKWIKGAAATNAAEFIPQIGFPATQRYVGTVQKRREQYRPDFD